MSPSRRRRPVEDTYEYEIPDHVRSRIIHTMRSILAPLGEQRTLEWVFNAMYDKLLQRYGHVQQPSYRILQVSDDPVEQHFFSCDADEALEFLEMCFETDGHCGGQPTVAAINGIFQQEGIGYELSDFIVIQAKRDPSPEALFCPDPNRKIVLPLARRLDEKVLHAEVVKPCLHALSDARFATANGELSNAFSEYRQGNYSDTITDAGAAFESVLKVICIVKGWTFDNERDTCSKLLDICRDKGLFHGFYRPVLEGAATVRNKVGDAHGKGASTMYPATKELADHMLYMVCNNINLVVALAKI